jgi:hypothetical protein
VMSTMKVKLLFALFFLVITSLSLCKVCLAEKRLLGYISDLSGEIQIRAARGISWKNAELNMPVDFGDHLRTGKTGRGTVTFTDRSILKIHPSSHIALNAFVSPLERSNSVLLFFGRLWNRLSKGALKWRGLEVQTPTAVCGVRGTEFWTASYEDGNVTVDNEISQRTISSDEGTRLSFVARKIEVEPGFKVAWDKAQIHARQNLFADGKRYGTLVHKQIYKRRDHVGLLVEQVKTLSKQRERYISLAKDAEARGDDLQAEHFMSKARDTHRRIEEVNRKIAFYGRRLECHFGLFSRYGYLAKHPEFSKVFMGKEFILEELDNIEMIHAEFNAMIEEGMKMSMEDMEDLIDEMRGKIEEFKKTKGRENAFKELE